MKRKLFFIVCIAIASIAFLTTVVIQVEAARRSYGGSSYRSPSYRNYSNGGSLYYQRGYLKRGGSYVQPHLKTKPDNTIYNNRKYRLGY